MPRSSGACVTGRSFPGLRPPVGPPASTLGAPGVAAGARTTGRWPGRSGRLLCDMAYIDYRPETPEGREAQLQAIAIVTAGLDSPELLQQELQAALGSKAGVKSWTLRTISLGQVGMNMAALAATMDAENVEVISGAREQISP